MNPRIMFLATALLAATIGANAAAEPAQDTPLSKSVGYSDLNLSSTAGVAGLYRRIQRAAEQVCEYPLDLSQPRQVFLRKACKARATERAVLHVGNPALNALHLASKERATSPEQLARNK